MCVCERERDRKSTGVLRCDFYFQVDKTKVWVCFCRVKEVVRHTLCVSVCGVGGGGND